MSEVIKVYDLPAIERYAKAIQEFSKNVESASEETERQFNTKTGNNTDEALALTAFFERLNSLQNQVFHTFPQYIRHFSGSISHFENSISDAGFDKEAWTSETGTQEVGTKLTGEGEDSQLYAVKDTIKNLQSLLDTATTALGIENESLEATKTAAEGSLTSAKDSRQATHNTIQSAHDTFNTTLFDVLSGLMDLKNNIEVAQAKLAVTPNVVMDSIKNKTLTPDKIYYLDAIQSKSDAKIMTVILSEADYTDKRAFFTDLANVNTKDSSLGVGQIIVERLMYEVHHAEEDGSVPNLSIFMAALTQRDKESVKDYALRLSAAAEATGNSYKVQVDTLMPEFPPPGSPKEAYTEYFNRKNSAEVRAAVLALNNKVEWYEKLNSLFMYTAMNELGKGKPTTLRVPKMNGGFEDQVFTNKNSFKEGSFKLTKGTDGKGFSFTVSDSTFGSTNVKSEIIDEKTGLNIRENIGKIKDLNAEKSKLFASTVLNTVKDLGKLYAPAGVMIGIVEAGMSSDKDIKKVINGAEAISSPVLLDQIPEHKYSNKAKGLTKIAKNIYDYFEKSESYDKEIKNLKKSSEAEFWQYGGTSFTNDDQFKSNSQYISPSYDVEAYLKQQDLKKNGLRTYIAETAISNGQDPYDVLERFDKAIDQSKLNGDYDADMKALLSGKGNPNRSLEWIGFEKFYNGLEDAETAVNVNKANPYEKAPSYFTRDSYEKWSYLGYVNGVGAGGN
ncbi:MULTISPECIES: hypothetical protein [Streptococcus]|jgi:hypothetical protein|uniref:LXG domain-containing protein n=1 Tax=Streptococcus oralis TaxID=1303 RepID=A0A081R2B9_STROR|nr:MULTISPECIES: hypothetical protein [Streptococcus]KEQ49342.1 hypothetical protein SK143_2018 [Streptococcus oralis]MDN5015930.1 hypothetical protein [Streptococcus sp. SO2]